MWYTKSAHTIGRITLSGEVTEFQCPKTGGEPWDITAGPDGNLWFCEMSPDETTSTGKRLGRITTSGTVTMYGGLTGYHDLRSITCGPDNALWFTDVGANRIGRITTDGAVTEFPCGTGNWPTNIITGPDGALWFTNSNKICRMTTAGQLKEFPFGGDTTSVSGLTVGPDGALWSTLKWFDSTDPDIERNYVVRMTTSGEVARYEVANTLGSEGKITTGADGALWFTQAHGDDQGFVISNIGRITTTGAYTEYHIPGADMCEDIAAGPAGTIWAIEEIAEGYGIAAKLEINPALPPGARWRSTSYFAEGWTGEGFQEYACVQNPNVTTAPVWLTYMTSKGVSDTQYLVLAPTSRATVDINRLVGPGREVSLRLVSTSPGLVVERPMYFNYRGKWTGGSVAAGATSPSKDWYFAEGTTRTGFDEYVTVLNPTGVTANLTFRYMVEGEGETVKQGQVPPASRATFKAVDQVGLEKDISLHLESDQDVVAERPMYFDYQGKWTGGHVVVGTNSPSRAWYFAEGTTRSGFDEWLCLQNPNSEAITVDATYLLGPRQGNPIRRSYTVKPRQRLTVSVNSELGPEKDVSVKLTSDDDFIAERPMYFLYHGAWDGGHDVLGAKAPSKNWYFAEGYTGANFAEWLCVQNPNDEEARLEVTYYPSSGTPITKPWTVPANTRLTIDVNADAGADLEISTKVSSGQPVIVERSMYFNYNGAWTGGHDVVGFVP